MCFRPLDAAAASAVTRLLAAETASRLLDRQIRLDVAPDLVEHVASSGCDQVWPLPAVSLDVHGNSPVRAPIVV